MLRKYDLSCIFTPFSRTYLDKTCSDIPDINTILYNALIVQQMGFSALKKISKLVLTYW